MLYIFFIFFRGIVKKNFIYVVLASYIIFTAMSVVLFYVIDRYFYIAMPFVIIVVLYSLRNRQRVILVTSSILLVLSIATMGARLYMKNDDGLSNKINIEFFRDDNVVFDRLISEFPRSSYFLFEKPSYNGSVYVGEKYIIAGTRQYCQQVIEKIEEDYLLEFKTELNYRFDLSYENIGDESILCYLKVSAVK
eukprot:TRINITY_DN37363_c0_g1_i1.p1 TRINITY_DN37363_c0_g1~~TRINITY_DN37363_c0_g1_i1.p1  ORF type:complete len:211 (+),score=9.25 TRINITY_DN37363_c0_g1_i1:56-634(+)